VSDNGPQFSAQEFARFASEWDFSHVTSRPTYPQSNGLAEKAIHTAEQLLKKAKLEKRDPYLSLLEYRNAPLDALTTPVQLLMSRNLCSILPTTSNHLRPSIVHPDLVRERMEQKQATQRHYYNQGARELKPLASGEQDHVQTKSGNWKPATVLGQHRTPRSYTVRTSNGNEYRRNRGHLLTTRSLCARENPGEQGDKPETSTTTSKGHQSIEDTESEAMLNQKPTAYPQTQDPCNEPYIT